MSTFPLGTDLAPAMLASDPELFRLLASERQRQEQTLVLVASSSIASDAVRACLAAWAGNITAEGYPGARYHAGCAHVDAVEVLAMLRARAVFGAEHANVQPHSASSANFAVLSALLPRGGRIAGMELASGGHLTHGSAASFSGRYFDASGYRVDPTDGHLDLAAVAAHAKKVRPSVLICGSTAYPRRIDFAAFRSIADEVGAVLLADISHTAGLVAAGLHPSPVGVAQVVTACTHKQLYGPRGGIVLCDSDPQAAPGLARKIDRGVFPGSQGAPHMHAIAAKAACLAYAMSPGFAGLMRKVTADAATLADELAARGYRLVSGGTDTHMVVLDLRPAGITGLQAQETLEACAILTNKNKVPGDVSGPRTAGGLRLGSNTLALRALPAPLVRHVAGLVADVLDALRRHPGGVPAEVASRTRARVREICDAHPLVFPGQPGNRWAGPETPRQLAGAYS